MIVHNESSNGSKMIDLSEAVVRRGAEIPEPNGRIEVSVIMPCLNEEDSLRGCIDEALRAMSAMKVTGEVVVVDNGSTDASVEVALTSGARVVMEDKRGYGSACRRGLREARGNYLVLGDADGTYDFSVLGSFVHPLRNGADMVLGNRLNQDLEPGVMPWLHQRVGNPFLTKVINVLFAAGVSDAHCGLRSISSEAYSGLNVGASGMEFASEFLIEAKRNSLRITEVPIRYRRRTGGEPKLRTFRDGMRHLALMFAKAMRPVPQGRVERNASQRAHPSVDSAVQERA